MEPARSPSPNILTPLYPSTNIGEVGSLTTPNQKEHKITVMDECCWSLLNIPLEVLDTILCGDCYCCNPFCDMDSKPVVVEKASQISGEIDLSRLVLDQQRMV